MSSKAFLKISSIANGESKRKEEEILSLLNSNLSDKETTIFYLSAVLKQPILPVKHIISKFIDLIETSSLSEFTRQQYYNELITLFTPPTSNVNLALLKIILNLSTILESQKNLDEANELLKSLQIESYAQDFKDLIEFNKFKIELNSRIANNACLVKKYEEAESFLVRISPILQEFKDPEYKEFLRGTYNIYAKVMTNVGKWLDVSSRLYHTKDETFDQLVIKLLIFAPSTTYKRTLLETIKDPLNSRILTKVSDTPLFAVFNKMFDERLVFYEDFREVLRYVIKNNEFELPNLYLTEELSRAIIENNLIAASKIYETITIENFIDILRIDKSFVEEVIADMIREDRLDALIDDITGFIQFNVKKVQKDTLYNWKLHIVESCTLLDQVAQEFKDV
ncbi:hypothetical protein WICMUC_003698 [Wickerhamomyces mucosus]|uniref:PCI domain-containing protein n=1 Tax=Wickerhamomyces mucosus TaxID=1378264 RepID=A0A9P8TBF1_9ASCO|nr:hypothetical protein WICMUC_003698 [Wickerhamomyces mucosus]